MADLDTTNTFNDGDTVHGSDLNNIIDQALAQPGIIHGKTPSPGLDPVNDEVLVWDADLSPPNGTLVRAKVQALPSGVTTLSMTATPASVFGVTVGTPSTAPAIALTLDNQAADSNGNNKVLASPVDGSSGTPGFRPLAPKDMAIARTIALSVIDLTQGNYWIKQLDGSNHSIPLHLNGGIAGQEVTVCLFQQTAPAQTLVTWDTQDTNPGAKVRWPGDVLPVMTRFLVGVGDVYRFTCVGNGTYLGRFYQNYKP